jgi:hypothetical protein
MGSLLEAGLERFLAAREPRSFEPRGDFVY